MENKTIEALKWIVDILNKLKVPYRIGGGFAAYVYGSTRPINDIDISLPGKFFDAIVSETKNHIAAGPKHYANEKWDCNTLSLNYSGQDIDLTDVDTLRMSNKTKTEWVSPKEKYYVHDPVIKTISGIDVALFDPRDLIAYKKELDGAHQTIDIGAVQKYISSQGQLS